MAYLFIGTTGDHAGQSILAWTIARRLLKEGIRIGIFKPFGHQPVRVNNILTDRDAYFFKQTMKLKDSIESICPYPRLEDSAPPQRIATLQEEIKSRAHELLSGRDVLLILGSKRIFLDDLSSPVSDIALISDLDANVVVIHRFDRIATSIYSILSLYSLLKDSIKGIIINRVLPSEVDEVRRQLVPIFGKKGAPVSTVLPETQLLTLRSIREIKEMIHGEVLCGEEYLDRMVERVTAGSADLEGDLTLFKRVYNKIVLLQPDKSGPDKKASAGPRSPAGILLAGNRRPALQVVEAAQKSRIPLIITKEDHFTALSHLDQSDSVLSVSDETKVDYFSSLMESENVLNRLIDSVGVNR